MFQTNGETHVLLVLRKEELLPTTHHVIKLQDKFCMDYLLSFKMKDMKKILVTFVILLIFTAVVNAQLIPNFGAQRAGLSTLSFLKNDLNPRSAAMSGASVAMDADAFSAFTNPAATADLQSFHVAASNLRPSAGLSTSLPIRAWRSAHASGRRWRAKRRTLPVQRRKERKGPDRSEKTGSLT